MSKLSLLRKRVRELRNIQKGALLDRFFKTGKGEYAEGDVFYGISVPVSRRLAKEFGEVSLEDLAVLIASKVHEERAIALFILVQRYERSRKHGTVDERTTLKDWYLAHFFGVNNWDLVDVSARHILGEWILEQWELGNMRADDVLRTYATSKVLWERRLAMVACHALIVAGKLAVPFRIAEMLLRDTHDLMHKAVGWMLREAGKRDMQELRNFLEAHVEHMPRTTLRYAIEKMDIHERTKWMNI